MVIPRISLTEVFASTAIITRLDAIRPLRETFQWLMVLSRAEARCGSLERSMNV